DLIDQLALVAGNHDDAGKMRDALDRFVFVVDEVRRNKDKQEDQRDHDVVVQASPLIRPENVSANCAPDRAHGRDGAFNRRRGSGLLPVYLGIHEISNPRLPRWQISDCRQVEMGLALGLPWACPVSARTISVAAGDAASRVSTGRLLVCGPCPYRAGALPECARCRRIADSSRRWRPTYVLPLTRCRSTCAGIQSCSLPPDDSKYSPAAPENFRSSSTKKSRETNSAPATRLQCHKFWRWKIPYRRCRASPRGSAGQVSATPSRRWWSVFPVPRTKSRDARTSPVPPFETGADG